MKCLVGERREALLMVRQLAWVVLFRSHHEFLRVFKHLRCVSVLMQRWRFPFFNDEGVRLHVLCVGVHMFVLVIMKRLVRMFSVS